MRGRSDRLPGVGLGLAIRQESRVGVARLAPVRVEQ